MRTYGRITNEDGTKTWKVVQTDVNGYNDLVYITTLLEVLQLNLGESPFWANYGIPARQSVVQSIAPDFAVAFTQQRFSRYFASLIIVKTANVPPTYHVSIITHQGVPINTAVKVPQ